MTAATTAQRTLAGYLLLPRPKEAAAKVSFVVFGGLFAFLAFAGPMPLERFAARLGLAVVVLDLLVYQGRYVLNDIRGAEADARHPGRRGLRFPVGPDGRVRSGDVRAAYASVAARLLLAVLLAVTGWPGPGVGLLLTSCAVVLVVAVPYDALRARTAAAARNRFAAGGSRPRDYMRADAATVGVYLLVGAGYAVRMLAGVVAGAPGPLGPGLVVTAVVAFVAVGIVCVTMTWVLESAYLLAPVPGGYGVSLHLVEYPHLGPLIARSDRPLVDTWAEPGASMTPALLVDRPMARVRSLTWWTGAFSVAVSACAALGLITVGAPLGRVLAAAALGALGAALVVAAGSPLDILTAVALAVTGAAVLAVWAGGRGVWGAVPAAGVLATFLVFRRFDVRSVSVDRPEIRRGSETAEERAEHPAQP